MKYLFLKTAHKKVPDRGNWIRLYGICPFFL